MGRYVDYVNTRATPALVGTEKPLMRNAAGASIAGTTQEIADLAVVPVDHTLFVDEALGNNATAVRGDASRPWADVPTAHAAANVGDAIHMNGTFAGTLNIVTATEVIFYLSAGSTVSLSFDVGETYKITGPGDYGLVQITHTSVVLEVNRTTITTALSVTAGTPTINLWNVAIAGLVTSGAAVPVVTSYGNCWCLGNNITNAMNWTNNGTLIFNETLDAQLTILGDGLYMNLTDNVYELSGDGIVTGVPVDHTLFVDEALGNNATAVRGDASKPYATIVAAHAAAAAGDAIVLNGTFAGETITDTTAVTMYVGPASTAILTITGACTLTLTGPGEFVIVSIGNTGAVIYFYECNVGTISCTAGSPALAFRNANVDGTLNANGGVTPIMISSGIFKVDAMTIPTASTITNDGLILFKASKVALLTVAGTGIYHEGLSGDLTIVRNIAVGGTVDGIDIAALDSAVVKKATYDAQSVLAAVNDDTPVVVTMAVQTVLARLTAGNIDDVAIGIADNNMVQIDDAAAADDEYMRLTANGAEGRSIAELRADIGLDYENIYIDAGAMVPRTTNGAIATTEEYATNDVMMDYMLFEKAIETACQFKFPFPDNWDLGVVKAKFYWDAATGASAADIVTIGITGKIRDNDDPIDVAFAASVDTDDVVIAVGDMHISAASADIGIANGALGAMCIFEITRVIGGNDDMAEDMKLFGVALQFKRLTTAPTIW